MMVKVVSFFLALFVSTWAHAVSNPVVNLLDNEAGATTTYEFIFNTDRMMNSGDIIVVQTNNSSGPNFSNTTLNSTAPAAGAITNRNQTSNNITLSGSIANAAEVTIIINGIVNPGSPGQGPDYTIRTVVFDNGIPSILEATVAGSVYSSSNAPAVSSPLPDQTIFEGDSQQELIADLNNHFIDGDMDDLTFSIDAGHDLGLVDPVINGDQLLIDGLGAGTTTVTVRASDLPTGTGEGEVSDSFAVRVIGELDNAMVQVGNDQGGATTDYTFTFDAVDTINSDRLIIIQNDLSGSDYSSASLGLLTGGTLSGSELNISASTFSIQINSGAAGNGDPIQVVLNDVVNPSISGQGPDITIRVLNQFSALDEQMAVLNGINFGTIFGTPEATNVIDRANLNEADGQVTWVNDLNNHFIDPDGDALTFTAEPGYDTQVVSAQISGSQLSLNPLMNGSTTIEIKASDLPTGMGEGEASQSFTVSVLGELGSFSVTPMNSEVDAVTEYEISFTSDDVFAENDVLGLQTMKGGPDFSNVPLGAVVVSSGAVNVDVFSRGPDAVAFNTTSGSVQPEDTITFTITGVINPADHGTGAGYSMNHISGAILVAVGNASGNDFINSDVIFADGFDPDSAPFGAQKRQHMTVLSDQYEFMIPADNGQ